VIFRLGDKKCSSTIKYKVLLTPRLGLLSLSLSRVLCRGHEAAEARTPNLTTLGVCADAQPGVEGEVHVPDPRRRGSALRRVGQGQVPARRPAGQRRPPAWEYPRPDLRVVSLLTTVHSVLMQHALLCVRWCVCMRVRLCAPQNIRARRLWMCGFPWRMWSAVSSTSKSSIAPLRTISRRASRPSRVHRRQHPLTTQIRDTHACRTRTRTHKQCCPFKLRAWSRHRSCGPKQGSASRRWPSTWLRW